MDLGSDFGQFVREFEIIFEERKRNMDKQIKDLENGEKIDK